MSKKNGTIRITNLREVIGFRNKRSNKATLFDVLIKNYKKPVPVSKLSKAVYGKPNKTGALSMLLMGCRMGVEKTPFVIARQKTARGETAYALQPKQ